MHNRMCEIDHIHYKDIPVIYYWPTKVLSKLMKKDFKFDYLVEIMNTVFAAYQ